MTREEITHEVAQCKSLPELDELIGQTAMSDFFAYRYEFLFGAYLLGIQVGELAKEEFENQK